MSKCSVKAFAALDYTKEWCLFITRIYQLIPTIQSHETRGRITVNGSDVRQGIALQSTEVTWDKGPHYSQWKWRETRGRITVNGSDVRQGAALQSTEVTWSKGPHYSQRKWRKTRGRITVNRSERGKGPHYSQRKWRETRGRITVNGSDVRQGAALPSMEVT